MAMPAVEEIILEIDEYVLQLRVGCKIIASAVLEDRALVKLSHMGRPMPDDTACDFSTWHETDGSRHAPR
jgi:hypothetical protein